MTGRRTRDEIERRLEDVRRQLREHHAGIEPDTHFADRVIARLPKETGWSFDRAARRILPVSIVIAVALTIAVVATGRSTSRTIASASASATTSSEGDLLEWVLESREERR